MSRQYAAKHMTYSTTNTCTLKRGILSFSKKFPDQPVILIDDSDIVKPDGREFEALGIGRDGSKSTAAKSVFGKGYHAA